MWVLFLYQTIPCVCLCAKCFFSVSGMTLTLSTLLEGKNFNQGGHKLGLGVDFEA